jgi:hypothetical protein
MTRAAVIAAIFVLATCGSKEEEKSPRQRPPVDAKAARQDPPPAIETPEAYVELLRIVADQLATRMERLGHELRPCKAPLLPPGPWRVDHARLVELTGGPPAPADGLEWLSDPPFLSLEGNAPLLPIRPPVLLVVRTESRGPDHLRGMLYAFDHATGDLLCHAPLSVTAPAEDLRSRFGDAAYEALQRMRATPRP